MYSWFHRWKAEGLKGLVHRPKSGRPAIADTAYLQVVDDGSSREIVKVPKPNEKSQSVVRDDGESTVSTS